MTTKSKKTDVENIVWSSVDELRADPKNPNHHSDEQIERLARIIEYQGWRWPIIVSKQTGFIVAGHGRLAAAKKLGLEAVPVSYQDFESDEQAYAFMVSDNAIAEWAELDLSQINVDIADLGPDFDIELLGLNDFRIDVSEKDVKDTNKELDLSEFDSFQHECPKCGFEWNDN